MPEPMFEPNPIDVEVGARVRALRNLRGLTQSDLAHSVGITFQQLQKYERGANRISASRLWGIAKALDTTVAELFGEASGANTDQTSLSDFMDHPRGFDLLQAWTAIRDVDQQRALLDLMRSMATKRDPAPDQA